jgi:hypothetical protein
MIRLPLPGLKKRVFAESRRYLSAITTSASRASAILQLRYRHQRRVLRPSLKRASVNVIINLSRLGQRIDSLARRLLRQLQKVSATTLALLTVLCVYLFVQAPAGLKPEELHLASATIIGAALALVLSLSIIPAQKAAEAFSSAILNLYARDRALLLVFITLVATTMASVLLGAGWIESIEPKYAISIQLVLLGVSFDALRQFYARTLDLLVPQTAVKLVLRECSTQLAKVRRTVERLVGILAISGGGADHQTVARAVLYAKSQIARSLRGWTAELDEAIARRDTRTKSLQPWVSLVGNIWIRDAIASSWFPIGIIPSPAA